MPSHRTCPTTSHLAPRLTLVVIASLLLALPSQAGTVWKAIKDPGKAIPLFRNSHCTAAAWVMKYHGLAKSGESDKRLIATAWVYMQYCECDKPDKPIVWRVSEGLKKFCTARGHKNTPIKEKCRYVSGAESPAQL